MSERMVHLRLLLHRLLVVLLLFTLLRILFFITNRGDFPGIPAWTALVVLAQGLRFDLMTVVVANALFILFHLLPHPWRERRGYQCGLFGLFMVVNSVLLFLCCIDLPFYGFNGKRITRDVLGQAGAGFRGLFFFTINYWWATLAFALGLVVLWKAYPRRVMTPVVDGRRSQWALFGLVLPCFLLAGRGGWQYQGLSPAHASSVVPVAFAPLVTNSAFTFGHSLTQPTLRMRHYLPPEVLERLMPMGYAIRGDSGDRRMNVVLLIVESLGLEYLHTISGEPSYMPFMDSLCTRSFVYTRAFANAERSNKSLCALLGGVPSFTDDAFMNTVYAGDPVDGLGTRMKELGYSTAFLHGGINGEYKFDSFSKACGFDDYFGKDEFGDERYYDGHWGVYDEEFLQFSADRIGRMREPFCASIFTLSSHDPFMVPKRYKGRFPKGTSEIHESLGYVDMSLRRFFERASREPWYANTLFVITGDHTFQYNNHPARFSNPAGRFAVPIILFTGNGAFQGRSERIAQHLDIMPSILDAVGYEGRITTFGQSLIKRDRTDRAVQFMGGQYRLIQEDRLLLFDGERTLGLYAFESDSLCLHDLSAQEPERLERLTLDLQAIIQRHAMMLLGNNSLPNNDPP
jgi:hypothetical protein